MTVTFAFTLGSTTKVLPVKDEISETKDFMSASRIFIVTDHKLDESPKISA